MCGVFTALLGKAFCPALPPPEPQSPKPAPGTRAATTPVDTRAKLTPPAKSDPKKQNAAPAKAIATPAADDVTWAELDRVYNPRSKTTDLQKDEIWKQYKGRRVTWTGRVAEVSETFGDLGLQIRMNRNTLIADVIVSLKDSQRSRALALQQDDRVTFTGILESWGSLMPISLDDGEIVAAQ